MVITCVQAADNADNDPSNYFLGRVSNNPGIICPPPVTESSSSCALEMEPAHCSVLGILRGCFISFPVVTPVPLSWAGLAPHGVMYGPHLPNWAPAPAQHQGEVRREISRTTIF